VPSIACIQRGRAPYPRHRRGARFRAFVASADRLFRSRSIPLDALETQGAAIGQRGRSPLYAAIDRRAAAVIGVSDSVKAGAPSALGEDIA
jgi:cation transport ATPase